MPHMPHLMSGPSTSSDIRRDVMARVGASAFRQFNVAFALMSLIPLIIGAYLLAARLFTIEVFEGWNGFYFFLAIVLALLGFVAGRQILKAVLAKLIDTSVRLRQHEVVKSGFVANVAYELRPPLAAVHISLKNMADELLGPLTDPQRKTVQECYQVVDRLARLTTDLIEITETGSEPKFQMDVFELQEAVREAVRVHETALSGHRLTVRLALPPAPALCYGDAAKLTQAISSLLDHAVRWSSEGSEARLELTSFLNEWRLTVSHDIASGKTEVARALDTFVRLGGQSEQVLGLGLHLARDIVERHHGRFWAEGEPGKESRLVMVLPAAEAR